MRTPKEWGDELGDKIGVLFTPNQCGALTDTLLRVQKDAYDEGYEAGYETGREVEEGKNRSAEEDEDIDDEFYKETGGWIG
jgi:hypothetical protein